MDNLFKPGKWLVLFCGVFVLLWGALQYVANARLKEEARIVGTGIFNWVWPDENWASQANITDVAVIRKSQNDAVVKIKGKQHLGYIELAQRPTPIKNIATVPDGGGTNVAPSVAPPLRWQPQGQEYDECAATLTFYRTSVRDKDYWALGKVELE